MYLGLKKDPGHIGNITKNIDNSVNDTNGNNINSRRKDKSEIGVIECVVNDVIQPSFDSVNCNDTACSDVVIVIGVEKDPAHIGNVTKNFDNSVNDSNDNNMDSRRKDKSVIRFIDHVLSDVKQPSFDSVKGNDTASSDTINVTRVEKDPVNISSVNKKVDHSINGNSDNKVSVIVMDFGPVCPNNVSYVSRAVFPVPMTLMALFLHCPFERSLFLFIPVKDEAFTHFDYHGSYHLNFKCQRLT